MPDSCCDVERHGVRMHRPFCRWQIDFVEMRFAIRRRIDAQTFHCRNFFWPVTLYETRLTSRRRQPKSNGKLFRRLSSLAIQRQLIQIERQTRRSVNHPERAIARRMASAPSDPFRSFEHSVRMRESCHSLCQIFRWITVEGDRRFTKFTVPPARRFVQIRSLPPISATA